MSQNQRFHLVPIGGTAMVPLAALLLEEGHRVTGSEQALYPPMSTLLEKLGIPVASGFAAEHVPADCDAVVVGNAALRDNVEAAEAARRGLPVLSLPQTVRRILLPGKTSIVITGTHGKTTTSALTAWLLLDSGRDPGFLVGGEMKNLGRGYRRGKGPHFVLEGDEYNAAFFDRGAKFLHYEPRHLFVGNIEYDHADLYPDLESVIEAFRQVVRLVPPEGMVVLNADDPRVAALASEAAAGVVRVSLEDARADFSARDVAFHPEGTEFTLLEAGMPIARLSSPMLGRHNVRNALGAIALVARPRPLGRRDRPARCRALPACAAAWRSRARRTASSSSTTSPTTRRPSPERSRPRARASRGGGSGRSSSRARTRRGARCSKKSTPRPSPAQTRSCSRRSSTPRRLGPGNQLDRDALVRRFAAAGKPAFAPGTIEEIPAILRREARPGDVLLLMSSGAFGGLPETLLDGL